MEFFKRLGERFGSRFGRRAKIKIPKPPPAPPHEQPPHEQPPPPKPKPPANKPPPPPPLGSLSATYESGKRGHEAIGYDHAGGASYGRYQIAYKVGTLARFMDFLVTNYPNIHTALSPHWSTAGSTKGAFAKEWRRLARAGKLMDSEHAFIKVTHYDACYRKMNATAQSMVDSSHAIQQVLWSTAVQHGSSGGRKVFNQAAEGMKTGKHKGAFIKIVYARRRRRLGNLNVNIKRAVLNRYTSEERAALKLLKEFG